MSTGKKVAIFFAGYALLLIAMCLIFGSDGKNDEFQPQNEFLLDPWVSISLAGIDMSINKAVLYIVMALSSPAWRWSTSPTAWRRSRTRCRWRSRSPTTWSKSRSPATT